MRTGFPVADAGPRELLMSHCKTTMLVSGIVAIVAIGFAVLLLGPFNGVQSFSVIADNGNASPLAGIVSRAMFALLAITGVGVAAWFCFRTFRRPRKITRRP